MAQNKLDNFQKYAYMSLPYPDPLAEENKLINNMPQTFVDSFFSYRCDAVHSTDTIQKNKSQACCEGRGGGVQGIVPTWHLHTGGYLPHSKDCPVLPFATTKTDLKHIMLRERKSDRERKY